MQQLRLSTRTHDASTVVALSGELDLATAPELDTYLDDVAQGSGPHIVLDLSGLTFMDSTGIRILIRHHRQTAGQGGRLGIAAPQPIVAKALKITGLDQELHMYERVEDALV